jgi:hypothetical protein
MSLLMIAVSGAMASAGPTSPYGAFGSPLDDAQSAELVGTGGGTTHLSIFVQEAGAIQGQLAGEDLRVSLSMLFADVNVETFANKALIRG